MLMTGYSGIVMMIIIIIIIIITNVSWRRMEILSPNRHRHRPTTTIINVASLTNIVAFISSVLTYIQRRESIIVSPENVSKVTLQLRMVYSITEHKTHLYPNLGDGMMVLHVELQNKIHLRSILTMLFSITPLKRCDFIKQKLIKLYKAAPSKI